MARRCSAVSTEKKATPETWKSPHGGQVWGPWGQAWALVGEDTCRWAKQGWPPCQAGLFMVWATPAPRLQAYWGWLPPRDPSTGTFWDSSQFSELFPNLVLCLPHGLVPDAYPPLLPSSFLLEGYPESGSRLLPGCTPERTHILAGALWFRTRLLQILALPAPLNASFRPHQMLVLSCSQNLLEGVGLCPR